MPINTNAPYVLVVGGAGFIGSHMVLSLKAAGFQPIVLDNLSKGHADAVLDAPLVVGEMGDVTLLAQLFRTYDFIAIMHFASYIEVEESIKFPDKYYQNNVAQTLSLLDAMVKYKIKNFIYSSTAAVYGEPLYTPIDEGHALNPINPYGRSKKMVEEMIKDYAHHAAFHYAILRYFNAAGADPLGRLSERHTPETHFIPRVLQVARGEQAAITIYGRDYATPDGTCVRDYVHVNDLCKGHLQALKALLDGEGAICCNLGTGLGHSILEVLDAARVVTGKVIQSRDGERRLGDPAVLVADVRLAKKLLNWQANYADLKIIIQHAWESRIKQKTLEKVV